MKFIGPYQVTERIGGGGMAEVFKGMKKGPDGFQKAVALKQILPPFQDNGSFMQMLSTEARLVIRLNHPNIVSVLDLFESEGSYVIVMEYVSGQNLKQIQGRVHKSDQRVSWQQAVYIVAEILAGLDVAHKCVGEEGPLGIVHRDVSPQNILVSYDGQVKLTDFGIARADIEREETRTGILKGKLKYCSPEYLTSQEVTFKGDLFSSAVVLFELLYGHHPFEGANEIETMERIKGGGHEVPRDDPNIPSALKDLVLKSLSVDPEDRPSDASDFRLSLLSFLDHPWLTSGRARTGRWMHDLYPRPEDRILEPYEDTAPFVESSARTEVGRKRVWPLLSVPVLVVFGVAGFWMWSQREKANSLKTGHAPTKLTNDVHQKSMVPKWPLVDEQKPEDAQKVVKTEDLRPAPGLRLQANPVEPERERSKKDKGSSKVTESGNVGFLFVEGPEGAVVFVNGVQKGHLPMTRMKLQVGSYVVHIISQKQGSQSVRTLIQNGKTAEARWDAQKR